MKMLQLLPQSNPLFLDTFVQPSFFPSVLQNDQILPKIFDTFPRLNQISSNKNLLHTSHSKVNIPQRVLPTFPSNSNLTLKRNQIRSFPSQLNLNIQHQKNQIKSQPTQFLKPTQHKRDAYYDLTSEEKRLYHMLMNYRAQHGLPPVPVSRCLNYVAKVHCIDQQISSPLGRCNLHSWSNLGTWSSCCYTKDHKQAKCMWNKPRELTPYKGHGFEIATYTSAIMTPETAFDLWKNSPPHNDLILNKGAWKGKHFKAFGIGLSRNYCNGWFGLETDTE